MTLFASTNGGNTASAGGLVVLRRDPCAPASSGRGPAGVWPTQADLSLRNGKMQMDEQAHTVLAPP